jgi:hypothetical protein
VQKVALPANLTPEEFFKGVVKEEGDHWRWPTNNTADARFGKRRAVMPKTWCDGTLPFKCLNPEHQTSLGTIPSTTADDVFAVGAEGSGFSVIGDDRDSELLSESVPARLRRLENKHSLYFNPKDRKADEFLRERGYNTKGRPFKNNTRARIEKV